MKKLFLSVGFLLLISFMCYAKDIIVKDYRQEGASIKPHYRSGSEDGYGRPSYQQKKTYQVLPVSPTYKNDYDNGKIVDKEKKNEDEDEDEDDVGENKDYYPRNKRKTYIYRGSKEKQSIREGSSDSADNDKKEE